MSWEGALTSLCPWLDGPDACLPPGLLTGLRRPGCLGMAQAPIPLEMRGTAEGAPRLRQPGVPGCHLAAPFLLGLESQQGLCRA